MCMSGATRGARNSMLSMSAVNMYECTKQAAGVLVLYCCTPCLVSHEDAGAARA